MDCCRVVICAGADIDAVDNNGRTPLQHAAFEGHGVMVALLCEAGANTVMPDDVRAHQAATL